VNVFVVFMVLLRYFYPLNHFPRVKYLRLNRVTSPTVFRLASSCARSCHVVLEYLVLRLLLSDYYLRLIFNVGLF